MKKKSTKLIFYLSEKYMRLRKDNCLNVHSMYVKFDTTQRMFLESIC